MKLASTPFLAQPGFPYLTISSDQGGKFVVTDPRLSIYVSTVDQPDPTAQAFVYLNPGRELTLKEHVRLLLRPNGEGQWAVCPEAGVKLTLFDESANRKDIYLPPGPMAAAGRHGTGFLEEGAYLLLCDASGLSLRLSVLLRGATHLQRGDQATFTFAAKPRVTSSRPPASESEDAIRQSFLKNYEASSVPGTIEDVNRYNFEVMKRDLGALVRRKAALNKQDWGRSETILAAMHPVTGRLIEFGTAGRFPVSDVNFPYLTVTFTIRPYDLLFDGALAWDKAPEPHTIAAQALTHLRAIYDFYPAWFKQTNSAMSGHSENGR